jgi:hypothetical protein
LIRAWRLQSRRSQKAVYVHVDVDGFLGANLNYRRWLALRNKLGETAPHTAPLDSLVETEATDYTD